MDEDIKKLDEQCKTKCRLITTKLKGSLIHNLREFDVCMMGRRAIASATRFPLYEAIASNHFTTVLMPGQIREYREGIIKEVEAEYTQIYDDNQDVPCPSSTLPPLNVIRPIIAKAIEDSWFRPIAAEVSKTCLLKIEVYEKYRPRFLAEDDEFRAGICDECIRKNREYIRELERL
jgi:hypothetical protein